jgi:hypothetical protein
VKFLQLPPLPPHWSKVERVKAVLGALAGAAELVQLLLLLQRTRGGGASQEAGPWQGNFYAQRAAGRRGVALPARQALPVPGLLARASRPAGAGRAGVRGVAAHVGVAVAPPAAALVVHLEGGLGRGACVAGGGFRVRLLPEHAVAID